MVEEYNFKQNGTKISVKIRRSARKTVALEVKASGEVIARVPNRFLAADAEAFIERHRAWILKKVELTKVRELKMQELAFPKIEELTAKDIEAIQKKLVEKTMFYARKMKVSVGRITIRNQKTRWGSCSSKGNLNFNYRLYYLPEELLEYVIVHELAHRRHMNHSKEFWEEVAFFYPDYKACRERLKEYHL